MARQTSLQKRINSKTGTNRPKYLVSNRGNKNAMASADLRGIGKAGAKKGAFMQQIGSRRQKYGDIRKSFGLSTG